jgi:thymidylate synthase (FAD)
MSASPFSSSVRLISHSTPSSELKDIACPQDLIAFCARVSNPSHQMNTHTAERLIAYLIRNQHWSPLEMVNVCLEITTTRDIARQILRHRSFSFQEFSQRYANPIMSMGTSATSGECGSSADSDIFVLREARLQDLKNRQHSIPLDPSSDEQHRIGQEWLQRQLDVIALCRDTYLWAIEHGIAKEQARCVLPEGNTQSRLYMNGSVRSWLHYIQLRTSNGTQQEHVYIAQQCSLILAKLFPVILHATKPA